MPKSPNEFMKLAHFLAEKYAAFAQVQAVALGGSQAGGIVDAHSDIDLYVFLNGTIPIDARQQIISARGASRAEVNLSFWDIGDEWFDRPGGIEVDVMFWQVPWIEEQIDRVVVRCEASVGYTTCFWHTIKQARMLFDRHDWFSTLQGKCKAPFPEKLRNAIIAKNHPVLRNVIPSYFVQIKKAIEREDLISVNHRLTALLASYFEVIYAVNRVLNPGEKKILPFVEKNCRKFPQNMRQQVARSIEKSAKIDRNLLQELDMLIDGLDDLLLVEGIDPNETLGLD